MDPVPQGRLNVGRASGMTENFHTGSFCGGNCAAAGLGGLRDLVPEGHLRIAQRFNVGWGDAF